MQSRKYLYAIVFAALSFAQLNHNPARAETATSTEQSKSLSQALSQSVLVTAQTSTEAMTLQQTPAQPPGNAGPPGKNNEAAPEKSKSHMFWWIGGIIGALLLICWIRDKRHAANETYTTGDPYDRMRPRGRTLSQRERRELDEEHSYLPPMTPDEEGYIFRKGINQNEPKTTVIFVNTPPKPATPPEPSMEPRYQRQSSAQLVLPTGKDKKSFADVAGQDETIARLREICTWLKQPEIYNRHNAELPRGILFVGPPGTGKTLSAQALAGETHGSMFIIAASAFVEMYVGVGASRVRALFADAKAQRKQTNKPVIIFIDELDAVGGARGGGSSSNSEREQTLNQLLVEMDGFTKNEGIIVVAATNRVDMLDAALRRKGRFDLEVHIDLPDLKGREAIFKVHTRDKVVAPEVDFELLAKRTFGMSGADLKAAANEAAIIAARTQSRLEEEGLAREDLSVIGKTSPITLAMFDEAISVVESGEARRERFKAMTVEDKKQTAYHELGHAVVIHKTGGDPITKITILPRGRALGYVQTHTENDRWNMTEANLRNRITAAMAGRIAQEIFMNTVDTGASNDFEQANRMARKMVTEFGMSPLGALYVPEGRNTPIGPALADEIDARVRLIVSDCAAEARRIIEAHRQEIEDLVSLLIEK